MVKRKKRAPQDKARRVTTEDGFLASLLRRWADQLAKAKDGPRSKDKKAAEDALEDPEAAKNVAAESEARANFFQKRLKPVWDDLCTMIRLVRAYASGDYREIPWRTIVMIVAALFYFLSPLDLVPDYLPLIGLTDDVTVLGFAAKFAHEDLEAFRAWERKRKADAPKA